MTGKWHGNRRPATTDTLRVDVPALDLDQIDALVDPGFYGNRGDFVRAAIRAQIAAHADIASTMQTAQARAAAVHTQDRPVLNKRLLELLRCPACGAEFTVSELPEPPAPGRDAPPGLLTCHNQHTFPVVGGIPRIYPGAFADYTGELGSSAPRPENAARTAPERRTRDSFGREWAHHRLGDPTWYIETSFRVGASFLHPLRLSPEELADKTVLDVGCGNGSQTVAYADHVAEVIGIDISTGVDLGQALLEQQHGPVDRVHFAQTDLHAVPLESSSVDIVHAHGVLHHTPDTRASLAALRPLLRPGGVCYAWLYSDGFVTPRVRALRRLTTRLPLGVLDRASRLFAPLFAFGVAALNRTGLRSLPPMSRRAATLTLLDVFGPPHMRYHTAPEVMRWFEELGFTEVWSCLHSQRGFAVCGRLPEQAGK